MDEISLEYLRDQHAVSQVLYGYARGIDQRNWKAFRTCFCDEVLIDVSSWSGAPATTLKVDQWVETVRDGLSGFDSTQHMITNHQIDCQGDRAHATSNVQATHVLGDEQAVLGGGYDTHLIKTDVGWQIHRNTLNVTWRSGRQELFLEARERWEAQGSGSK